MTIAWLPSFARRPQPRHPHFQADSGPAASQRPSAAPLAHTFLIGMQTMEAGYAPLVGTTAAVSASVGSWPRLSLRRADDGRARDGRLRHGPADRLASCRRCTAGRRASGALRSPLFTIHVLSMLFAYACFALAAGRTYVLLLRRSRRSTWVFLRAAPRCRCSTMNAASSGGLPDVGLVSGGLGDAGHVSRPRAGDVVGIQRSCRAGLGPPTRSPPSRGGRSAGADAAPRGSPPGFVLALLNFVPVGHFLTRSHNF
jgi:hypothetical protein